MTAACSFSGIRVTANGNQLVSYRDEDCRRRRILSDYAFHRGGELFQQVLKVT